MEDILIKNKPHVEAGSDSGIEDPAILSEEGDFVPQTIIRASDFSPKHRHGTSWEARFPRTLYEHELHGFAHHARLYDRRMSDPGRLSVSPSRSRPRIKHGLSDQCLEEETEDENGSLDHPRLTHIRNTLLVGDTCGASMMTRSLSPGRSRPRERTGLALLRRTQRSFSLPNSDGAIIEINEALGALAIFRPVIDPLNKHTLHVPAPGRRRSISMEPAFLESIAEESNAKANRRFSTSHLDT